MTDVIDLTPYSFVDFGCGDGRSLELGRRLLGGARGLGLDSDLSRIEDVRRRGFDAIEVDAARLPRTRGSVEFCVLSHFLEHLTGFKDAERCLKQAIALSSRFVYVQQPWFDSDSFLLRRGLKLYWSDWSGHPNRMNSLAFQTILWPLRQRGRIARYCIAGRDRIETSASPEVHPLTSPTNSQEWNDEVDGPKPHLVFDECVYRELVVVVAISDATAVEDVLSRVKAVEIFVDSNEMGGTEVAAEPATPEPSS
ncbi:MAG: methyltransferase domain-containing protein [Deltaproteobacteria bacterium]|nr:methyltransferase domain-containing protein [Deltaproteobacteria bacterium]